MELAPFPDFSAAATAVLEHMHRRLGFELWSVMRVEGDDAVILEALDQGYGVKKGDVLSFSDTLCARMVAGLGPHVAPQCASVPAYRDAPITRELTIGAYVGMPLRRRDGGLFGTLYALDPLPQPEAIVTEQPYVELAAQLLASVLEAEIQASEEARRLERAETPGLLDVASGLWNRRGWEHLVASEESRCSRYGHTACVVAIDVARTPEATGPDGGLEAGAVTALTRALRTATRGQDLIARITDTEFAVLAVECDRRVGEVLLLRLRKLIEGSGLHAALGLAKRSPSTGLVHAWQMAQHGMYPPPGSDRRRTGRTA